MLYTHLFSGLHRYYSFKDAT